MVTTRAALALALALALAIAVMFTMSRREAMIITSTVHVLYFFGIEVTHGGSPIGGIVYL
jgi:hypothetical protein